MIEQIDTPRIDARQQIAIEIGLRLSGRLVGNAELPELLARPFARVSVARDLDDAIFSQRRDEFIDHILGATFSGDIPPRPPRQRR